ncbi:hypothetical protein [Cerasicoccus fimbriatus]|uniref:hypothetical protein n=1 Tax=Cerasicoccus fimbriatus TaxID=3014554 RepID=UPI0022B2FD62|nr:hypothetical protein [Cerasicoccus sp. TK19100]
MNKTPLALGLMGVAFAAAPILNAITYSEWAIANNLPTGEDSPSSNPDNDTYPNALEYVFGTDPLASDSVELVGPNLIETENSRTFSYLINSELDASTQITLQRSQTMDSNNWFEVTRQGSGTPDVNYPNSLRYNQTISLSETLRFYRLEFLIDFTPEFAAKVQVGLDVGKDTWDQIPYIDIAYIYQQMPEVTNDQGTFEDTSKYPRVIGAEQVAFTPNLIEDFQAKNFRPSKRSWMGWFLWGNGEPPPERTAGYPFNWDGPLSEDWDYYAWQFKDPNHVRDGAWTQVRVDQQPLYMQPLRLNYNWAPGRFGFETQPMQHYPGDAKYWAEKKIVRGVNLSPNYPFFVQYGNRIDQGDNDNYPDAWREAWLRMYVRPLETLVMVPSVLPPADVNGDGEYLLKKDVWNKVSADEYQPFPFPLFQTDAPAKDQTPWGILTDKMGDWHADIVYEGGHSALSNYDTVRYFRTDYDEMADGNYLKMTVAQGSPFVWCELAASHAAAGDDDLYMIFYNLIRLNLKGSIDNNGGFTFPPGSARPGEMIEGTNSETVAGGPWEVPGVDGVSYVLLYGNQSNPNQWFMEVLPEFNNLATDDVTNMIPGGYNQPGDQDNHTYFAVFYRTDSMEPVELGSGGQGTTENNGTDEQGNPYFFLKVKNDDPTYQQTKKAWFVVGQAPVMRYYHTDVTRDDRAELDAAAKAWADEMGKHAFNFLTDTKIHYDVANMNRVITEFDATYTNPYAEAGAAGASAMTAGNGSVWALFPHHYQPLTLGPDLTQASRPQVVWEPLKTTGIDFPSVTAPSNANKSTPSTPSRWDYWHPRGNLKSVVTDDWTVEYPFQNFLPSMPEPKWDTKYDQTGIQYVTLTDTLGYQNITATVNARIEDKRTDKQGSGAEFQVILEPFTGRVLQVDVVNGGQGYPEGNPPSISEVELIIDPPGVPESQGGVQAKARLQINGEGKVLATFMDNKGEGYSPTIKIDQPSNPNYEPAIIVPNFDSNGFMQPGRARVISGGSGYDFGQAFDIKVLAPQLPNTPDAIVSIANPGEIYGVASAGIGGFVSNGQYPLINGSVDDTADNITVEISAPTIGDSKPEFDLVVESTKKLFGLLIAEPGDYSTPPTGAYYLDDNNVKQNLTGLRVEDGKVIQIRFPVEGGGTITSRKTVVLEGGVGTEAKIYAYPGAYIQDIILKAGTADDIAYAEPVQIYFRGGYVGNGTEAGTFKLPEFDWEVDSSGKLVINGIVAGKAGSGWDREATFIVLGGRGHEAGVLPNISNGEVTSVDVLRPGSNYPTDGSVKAVLSDSTGSGVQLQVNVVQSGDRMGQIESIDVLNGGAGYTSPTLFFVQDTSANPTDSPPRGPFAIVTCQPNGSGGLTSPVIVNDELQKGYLPGFDGETSAESGSLYVSYESQSINANMQMLTANPQAKGYLTQSVPLFAHVEQILYDNVIADYQIDMSDGVKPFGGAFGGKTAPDGYGLGNQLSRTTKSLNVLYQLQAQFGDRPNVYASPWAFAVGRTPYVPPPYQEGVKAPSYEVGLPVLADNNPFYSLRNGFKLSVQMLQRTLSLLHVSDENGVPYSNNPAATDPVWKMSYFSSYDFNAGRILINPSSTIPVDGVVSSVPHPPAVSAEENANKTGLLRWEPGKLWSGFGVSDQWNDQHYFFGYYLGVAGWAAIFDRAWETSIDGKPDDLWISSSQMGTALDQWYLSVANDPDNAELQSVIYNVPEFTYQKLPFFDQFTGHGWATGVQPGPAGAVLDATTPWSIAQASGTSNFKYGDENENSVWEGLQAFSAAILYGAGTDRKPLVDVGLYMLATGMAANDIYFADKNYNLTESSKNQFSWVPVTTIDSDKIPENGGNIGFKRNSSFVTAVNPQYYDAPDYFGGEASTGISLIRKYGPTLNNFFYAFPTGTKFITAYPPTAWTMGISRNSDYMRAWAGAMMQEDWREARDSSLFQGGNWLGMALTAALSGVPYNPGDEPVDASGTALKPGFKPYVDRLWASWASIDGRAGSEAQLQPAFSSTSVLHFLHTFDAYGSPDWTYWSRATDASGNSSDDSIMMMAAFSKLSEDGTSVETTFVAFNPGWETRYCAFDRLGGDGSVANANVSGVMTVEPKKMEMVTMTFPVN